MPARMLRFFRQIRQKLIQQENIRKYFWYALGEIFLVVIGILIALQINNWNETQKDLKTEIRYLDRLITEVNTDIENISRAITTDEYRKERALFLINASKDKSLITENPSYFIESIEYAGYTSTPVISNQTFEEIKSSGKLSLIRNEEVRNAISVYYTNAENRNQYRFITEDLQLKYLDYRVGILDAKQQITMGSFREKIEFTSEDAEAVYARFIERDEFVSWLPYIVQSKVRTYETYDGRLNVARELKETLEKELNRITK
ncbi:MAG TPA: hypothetical protein DEO59_16780 [Balneola sp.]|jgi:hypothetical protein|nr:hypothetical protein [Balneola sp.]MAO76280.1 hypothetical protein [Balneola sp.]MBF65471.1 hypothetical protein [Balneola sp.]HAW82013.1 hypothetical protein [Balneola sp.]HBZ40039.1 hypothetical protein [Balneola sp.]|tara:strand:- start:34819 stop:35601 length:783 start_codon:yes stop_codon:yes gene_type:complete